MRRSYRHAFGIAVSILVALLLLWFLFLRDFLAVDSCLDRGGSWDYSLSRCVTELPVSERL